MLFRLLKSYARLALRIYIRRLYVNKPAMLQVKGPVLFAANHPNSFLDGIILTTLLEETLYSLARGDAFTPRWNKWLRRIHLLPVYRTTEGAGNLAHNYTTFASCHEVFAQNGVVLIFSEALCVNEWKLRPLRKGTARLAISAWQKDIPLTVIPLGFNYSSFRSFGKDVHLLFGSPIQKESVLQPDGDGKQIQAFNQQLQAQLEGLVYHLDAGDQEGLRRHFPVPVNRVEKMMLALPALLGWLLHALMYYPVKWVAALFDSDHYDSVVAALHLLFYPLYLLLAILLVWSMLGWTSLLLLLLMPFTARALVRVAGR
ncbi:1-acyl-sn-glycerol-3-phosphate acyltransferase [Cnuella takakiae]|uniref:1-acyl-sn-glycerol-3-phosphate acyltransferase n=1 Tax=Cnuella takakiae TaxID=1302690 RepID=A0A1M5H410_9BACT|nr:1-acyl-sn-glycerol-3-phosphate acyltransferase [Cnuella takakiae]OLY91126.1 hypothetical protein BUE76_03810 [Cnuella takakiae]SHG10623.1 1-acyl-sn-glycerol-3-phosphate acyltransferase [Cnuella takakiae]